MNIHEEQMNLLGRLVSAAHDSEVFNFVVRQAIGILTSLGIDYESAEKLIRDTFAETNFDGLGLAQIEREIHHQLKKMGAYKNLEDRMLLRANATGRIIIDHLMLNGDFDATSGAEILDLGGGTGEIASWLQKRTMHKAAIADPLECYKDKTLTFLPVVDNKVKAPEGAFENVLLLMAAHHSDDPEATITEAFRLSRDRVIIIESVTNSWFMYRYTCWIDWFYNHVIHYAEDIKKKVNVPCNFRSAGDWQQLIWKLTGEEPILSQELGIFQVLNPEWHHLFVYGK